MSLSLKERKRGEEERKRRLFRQTQENKLSRIRAASAGTPYLLPQATVGKALIT
jgi:hypothetical protein